MMSVIKQRSFIYGLLAVLVFIAFLAVGCASEAIPPHPSPPAGAARVRTQTAVPATAEEAIRQLINAECDAVVQQDIDRLQGMWVSDGVVTDANFTPDNPEDDVKWQGWEALRDRYVNIVFPSNPTFCEHFNVKLTLSTGGDTATALSGIKIGTTNAPDSNRWTFKKLGNDWKIAGLTFNLKQ